MVGLVVELDLKCSFNFFIKCTITLTLLTIEKCSVLKPVYFYFQQNACNFIFILNRTKEYLVHKNEVRKMPIHVNEDRLMYQILITLG